jgi:hypothetical protein
MPRRLRLSALQREIMMTLEEAGAETIGTVVSTVKPPNRNEFNVQVDQLIKLGLIRRDETRLADRTVKTELVLTERGQIALRI